VIFNEFQNAPNTIFFRGSAQDRAEGANSAPQNA